MKQGLKSIDWLFALHGLIILLLSIYFNLQLINLSILANNTASDLVGIKNFSYLLFYISGLGLVLYLPKLLTWSFFKRLSTVYLIYLFLSYFLRLTRQLNNKDFIVGAFQKNQFWQGNFLLPLFFMILLAFFLHRLLVAYDKQEWLPDYTGHEELLFYLLSASFLLQDSQYRASLLLPLRPLFASDELASYHLGLLVQVTSSLLCFAALIFIFSKAWQGLRMALATPYLAVVSSAFFALFFNYTFQLGVKKSESIANYYVLPGAISFQLLILFALALLVYFMTNRYLIGSLLIFGLGSSLSLVNYLKEFMRSEPLLLIDFVWLRQLGLLIGFVSPSVIWLSLFFLIGLGFIYSYVRRRLVSPPIFSWLQRFFGSLFVLVSLVAVVYGNASYLNPLPSLAKLDKVLNINWLGFSSNARYKSLAYVWTKQLTTPIMEKPSQYNQAKIEELVKKYSQLAKDINRERTEKIDQQTVIYLLSESLANPERLDGIDLSASVLPNIDAIKEETTSGLMSSDGYGGGTANMEFQSLTGLPLPNFSSSVSVLYTEVVPKMKVFPSISDLYQKQNKVVIHPENRLNYSRHLIYQQLGFGKQVFTNSTKDKLLDVNRAGVNISDQTVYDNILARLDTKTSQFFSVITMQNHVPWSASTPEEVMATGQNFSAKENANLTSYARLLAQTDEATIAFLEALQEIDKPITVVFYGDHLPSLYPEQVFSEQADSKYQTDYFIWNNQENQQLEYPLIRSNDFPAALLAHTNAKVSPYYALLTQLLNREELSEKELEEVEADLKLLQYDMTIGKAYIKARPSFFEIK
ncbi:LTA synthase family protein [Streptococcus sp. sy018]|uniref:LTA synthase family protein n=1 Tax=Streptococcus sp. sy018 TaxID=2600147 RepID=UPI0011B6E364|nr:alkaline phosphatase family protein [Streptococcus sp. sy018]TWS95483.1 sulfatase-like hydrolase/transferase [Streptococcus sp. sy018]